MSMPHHKYRPYPGVELPDRTWPDTRITSAPRWVSVDLQIPLEMTHADPMMGTVTTKVTSVNRGEPDASLFQVPADYKVEAGHHGDVMYMPAKP